MTAPAIPQPRYRFGRFVVSSSRRAVLRDGQEVALIPRYFDLLLLLVRRRGEAIARRAILDAVWDDVVVSDGALSQAIRSLRRVLGDDPRNPVFIRTVPRHGYRFVFDAVIEEPDDTPLPTGAVAVATDQPAEDVPFHAPLTRLLQPAGSAIDQAEQRDAAEQLHALGTARTLALLDRRPGHEQARAILRDTRWDVPQAGPVPILGRPRAIRTSAILIRLRVERVLRLAGSRWLSAILVAAAAGVLAGLLGACALRFGPGSQATAAVFVALPLVALTAAAVGAAGTAGGMSMAEVLFRSRRGLGLTVCGALGGGLVGLLAHLVARVGLEGLFGGNLQPVAGGVEGLVIGGSVALGYALATPSVEGGMAAPSGASRLRVMLFAALACATAAGLLGWRGNYLGAMSLDLMARSFPGSQVGLGPLARLLGEPNPGVVTRSVISAFEGLMFGGGLVLGLTRRPRRR